MISHVKAEKKTKSLDSSKSHLDLQDDDFSAVEEESPIYGGREEWLLKFEVNEKGIGHILLPPSLSIFLQSDRLSIMPMAGGLFVRSV